MLSAAETNISGEIKERNVQPKTYYRLERKEGPHTTPDKCQGSPHGGLTNPQT